MFVAAIEAHLVEHGFRPRTVGRNEFTYKQPLRYVDDLMNKCAGTLVIALERLSIERGIEQRGTPNETLVSDIALPTPRNQIEAAFAYSKRMPLLVIKERRVREEGLLEGRYDWDVHSADLDQVFLSSPNSKGRLELGFRISGVERDGFSFGVSKNCKEQVACPKMWQWYSCMEFLQRISNMR